MMISHFGETKQKCVRDRQISHPTAHPGMLFAQHGYEHRVSRVPRSLATPEPG